MALVIVEKSKKMDRKWAGYCRGCGSKAECLQSDITHHVHDHEGDFSWEQCPECGAGEHDGYGGLLMYQVK